MKRENIETKFSKNLDTYLNGEQVNHSDQNLSKEEVELLNFGKRLLDTDYSQDSNKHTVYQKTIAALEHQTSKGAKTMKRMSNYKKSAYLVAATAVISICVTTVQTSFAQNFIDRIVQTLTAGRIEVTQYAETDSPRLLPKELVGKLFYKDGQPVEYFTNDREATDYYTPDGILIESLGDYISAFLPDDVKVSFNDGQEKINDNLIIQDHARLNDYTSFPVCLPNYLPENFQFDKAEFYRDEQGKVENSQYITLHFTNAETDESFLIFQRASNEETAYSIGTDQEIEAIAVNGHNAVIIGGRSIDWEANDVLYSIAGRGLLDKEELIKIAESIQ